MPADTANATPALTAPWIASYSAWLKPLPPRLMLATSIVAAFAATQSMPAMIHELQPLPRLLSTLTAHRRAPGATPTTPSPLSSAPMVPATCVPW